MSPKYVVVKSLLSLVMMMLSFTVSRLDEKEQEMRKEYNKLHERYTEVRGCLDTLWGPRLFITLKGILKYRGLDLVVQR